MPHQIFYDNVMLVGKIKDGGWRDLHSNGATGIDKIVFIYKTKVVNKGNKKSVSISEGNSKLEGLIQTEDDPTTPGQALTFRDLSLKVRYQRGVRSRRTATATQRTC